MGVATLDATGKVPSAQLPANPGNFLPLTGGTMQGSFDMDYFDISTAATVETLQVFTNEINSLSPDIKVVKPLDMDNNKIIDVAKGTSTKDVATIDNINDHDTSPFAHADIRNLIAAIQGTYIYVGTINLATDDVDDTALNNTVFAILGRTPLNGDVLVDNDNGEWRFDGTNWVNLGHFDIAMASAFNDGLMSKEDYIKLSDLLNKADFDILISTLATMDYLVTNYYNKAMVDAIETSLQEDIDTKEALANKAIDFSVINDTKYPTTKAVSERLLNLPIAELNNHTLREVFEGGNLSTPIDQTWQNSSSNTYYYQEYRYFTATEQYGWVGTQNIQFVLNDIYYIKTNSILNQSYPNLYLQVGVGAKMIIPNLNEKPFSIKWVSDTNTLTHLGFMDVSASNWQLNAFKELYILNLNSLGISALTVSEMDYWFSVYQALLVSDTNVFSLFPSKTLEAWLTPTLTGATTTYLKYRKDTLNSVIVEGNITVGTSGTNLTLPTGYRPLFAYTVGILTFNTDGTVVSSETGTQTLSIRFTGGA